jgi:hypothetical protein
VSTSPDGLLAAPSEYPFNNSRHRSTSLAPSLRSTKSNVTIVEDKENRTSVAKTQVLRQQTFKIQRKFDLIDRIKALWDPKGLIRKMETSIECVPPNALDEDVSAHVLFPFAANDVQMLNQTESPFIVDVHVSPKLDSTKYHKLRCLLDTGCLQGNIVSQEIVDSLGFTKADYEPLSWKEKQGGQSVTGELLTVDAAILLSWHHNTSPHRYRQMRFLISPCTKVDMIIGTRSIIKHNLMAPPVFMVSANAGKRALNTLQSGKSCLSEPAELLKCHPCSDTTGRRDLAQIKSRVYRILDQAEEISGCNQGGRRKGSGKARCKEAKGPQGQESGIHT